MAIDRDELTAYVLGSLRPARQAAVERHLTQSPADAEEVALDQEALAALVLDLEPEPNPEGELEQVLRKIRSRPTRPSWAWAILAAAVALVLLVGVEPSFNTWQQRQIVSSYLKRPGSVTQPLLGATGQPVGLLVHLDNGQVFLALDRPPARGRVYQAWQITSGKKQSLGIFQGHDFVTPKAIGPRSAVIGVTLEPPGGSPQPTSAPVAVAKL